MREASDDVKGRLTGLGAAVLLLPIIYVFAQHGEQSRGFVVFCVTGVFAAIIYARRKVALRPHFLLSIGVLYAVELSIALLIPLPRQIHGAVMIPITFANLFLLLWIVGLIERILADGRDDKSETSELP